MTNLQVVIPGYRVRRGNGKGHQYGLQKKSEIGRLFGLTWVEGTWVPGTRFTDPNYYGHWKYIHNLNQLPENPDFFQIIDYAMNRINGGASNPQKTFQVGAALIDQYDVDDLYDADPNLPNNSPGNPITIIDTVGNGNPADYVYGIEGMSYDDPIQNSARPPFAPSPPPALANYVLLNRRFENVGEFGYAYNPASTLASKTLDFFTAASTDKPMLDFFTYNTASPRAGIVNLNTRNGPVLASIIRGALLNDPGAENTATTATGAADDSSVPSRRPRRRASHCSRDDEPHHGAWSCVEPGDVARLAAAAVAAVPNLAGSDETKRTIARALADTGQARTWNLMIDVIAQTGQYIPGTPDLTDPTKFIVQGEKRVLAPHRP